MVTSLKIALRGLLKKLQIREIFQEKIIMASVSPIVILLMHRSSLFCIFSSIETECDLLRKKNVKNII